MDSRMDQVVGLERRLCEATFFVGRAASYEFRLRSRTGNATWTWDPEAGGQHGPASHPQCIVDLETEAAGELIAGSTPIRSLLSTGRLRFGGLLDAVDAFVSVFGSREERDQMTLRRARRTIPPYRRRGLVSELSERLAPLGTASELARLRAMLNIWSDNRIERCRLDQWVRTPFPDLVVSPWVNPAELEIDEIFRAAHDGLVAEAGAFLGKVKAPHYGGSYDTPDEPARNGLDGWRQWHIVSNFALDHEHAALFPVAKRVVQEVSRRHAIIHAYFLILEPGAVIPLHSDGVDWALSYHYGLIVPEGCSLTVANERRQHGVGKSLVFNDSFLHEAGNTSESPRVVFNIVLANPQLNAAERDGLEHCIRTLPAGAICYPH